MFELGLKKIDKEMVVHVIFVDTILYLIHVYLPHSGISLDVRQNLLVTPCLACRDIRITSKLGLPQIYK